MSTAPSGSTARVLDVADADFQREVLERSATTPVVADFWAEWCGPCRQLAPLLEGLAEEHAGAFLLARVNVDAAPESARRYQVRGIPAIMGFRDGQLVAQFTGAQPEAVVRRFVEGLLPGPADTLYREAEGLSARGHLSAAEERLQAALEIDPRHGPALLGLARLLLERGESQQALETLDRVVGPPSLQAEVDRLRAESNVRRAGPGDAAGLRARVQASPDDLAARLQLGRALAASKDYEEALEELLAVIRRDAKFADGAARQAMLDVFALLGGDDPLTARFRRELAGALYR